MYARLHGRRALQTPVVVFSQRCHLERLQRSLRCEGTLLLPSRFDLRRRQNRAFRRRQDISLGNRWYWSFGDSRLGMQR